MTVVYGYIYNKIDLAKEMLIEARKIYDSATNQMDHIKTILLSGAVLGIIVPLLKEKDIETSHDFKVDMLNYIFNTNEHSGAFKMTYNSLKHTGNRPKGINAWHDLKFEGHISSNSKYLLKDAEKDMDKLLKLNNGTVQL